MHNLKKAEILRDLRTVDIETPIGGQLVNFSERYRITDDVIPLFDRFRLSRDISNRSAALAALVVYGKRTGYEADAVLLHYQSRDNGSAEEFAAIDYLRHMRDESKSIIADRVLKLLDTDPYIQRLYDV